MPTAKPLTEDVASPLGLTEGHAETVTSVMTHEGMELDGEKETDADEEGIDADESLYNGKNYFYNSIST